MSENETLSQTGERLLPSDLGNVALEHLHRYAFSLGYVEGLDVLDVASGEGYGSNMLSGRAKSVIGIDIFEPAIFHARRKYGAHVDFRVGSCLDLPVETATIDVVTSFETLEHITNHQRFFDEIKRVLRPDGRLIISTPDKINYTILQNNCNKFHENELTGKEFQKLVNKNFKFAEFYEQSIFAGSILNPSEADGTLKFRTYLGDFNRLTYTDGLIFAPYVIAVSSDKPLVVDKRISLFKGWGIPTDWEKILDEAQVALSNERVDAELRINKAEKESLNNIYRLTNESKEKDLAIEEFHKVEEFLKNEVHLLKMEIESIKEENRKLISERKDEFYKQAALLESSISQIPSEFLPEDSINSDDNKLFDNKESKNLSHDGGD